MDYLREEKVEEKAKDWLKRELRERKSKFCNEFRESNYVNQLEEEEKRKLFISDIHDFVKAMGYYYNKNYGRNFMQTVEEVEFAETVTELPMIPFQHFNSIRKMILPKQVKEIPDCYFSEMDSLREVVLPEDLEVIGKYAFQSCRWLEKIKIPHRVKEIKDYAFSGCERLKDIILPKSLERLGRGVFMNVEGKIRLEENHSYLQIRENMLYSKDGKILYGIADYEAACGDYSKVEVTIRDEVRDIGEYAFFKKCFHKILVEDGRKEIPPYAFAGIKAMEFQLPEGIKKIKNGAFLNAKIKNLVGMESVIEIGDHAFSDFSGNLDFRQFKLVEKIGRRCFSGLCRIENFSIPTNLTVLKDEAFFNLKFRKEVCFPKTLEKIGLKLFKEIRALSIYDKVEIETSEKIFVDGEKFTVHKKNILLLSMVGDESFQNLKFKVYDEKDNLKYEVFFAINDMRYDMKAKLLSLMDENMEFDFETYDSLFPYIYGKEVKLEVALMRLKKPYRLTEETKKEYEAYVEEMKKESKELTKYCYKCFGRDDLEMLGFLGEYGLISEKRWDSMIEICRKNNDVDKMNVMMKWKMEFYDMF